MMNSDLDKDLSIFFEQGLQEFPNEPFIRKTLKSIEYSDMLFRRMKVCIASLVTLIVLVLAPWISTLFTFISKMILETLSFTTHSLFDLVFSPLALPSVILISVFYYLLAKLRIIRTFN